MRKGWVIFSLVLAGTAFAGRYAPVSFEAQYRNSVAVERQRINDVLNKPITVNVRNVSLTYLASLLSQHAKVPIVIRDIAYPQQVQAGQGGQAQAQSEYFTLSYYADGKPLSQVLDEITGMFDLWWKVEGGRIVIYKYSAKVFTLRLPFLQKRIEERNGSLTLAYQREFTRNLEASLQRLLRDSGSKVSVDEMGNVYVIGTPSEVKAIENAVNKINENFTKPIPLKIKVYLVSESDFQALGLSLGARSGSVEVGLGSAVGSSIFNLSVATSRIEMQLDALAQSGRARLVEESVLTALNGQPMVYSPLQKQRIISQFELSYVLPTGGPGTSPPAAATPTITMKTEDIQTGNTLIIVPYYVNEGTIAVDLYRRQDSLEVLETKRVNLAGFQNEVSLPRVSTKTNLNQTLLRKGETLVLFTSAQTLEQFRDRGIPFLKDIPILGYLFSTKERTKELYRLVITMEFM